MYCIVLYVCMLYCQTAQICCLSQILLDSYYRTIEGLCVLIEKDWCSFGHKFQDRTGHCDPNNDSSQELSPVFLQVHVLFASHVMWLADDNYNYPF